MWKFLFLILHLIILRDCYGYIEGPIKNDNAILKSPPWNDNPDTFLTAPELLTKYGYPVESHTVQTEDGYILTMHRVPYGRKSPAAPNKPVVLLHHGLGTSSDCWLLIGPEKALAYVLADAGYDVWMANSRGTVYSNKHVTLTTKDPKFWDFSWHEMGMYDVPAEIDYILNETGQKNLFFVGHSMGTTMFYVMGSTRPEYNEKIRAMFSLAPSAIMAHMRSPVRLIAPFANSIEWLANMIGIYEVQPTNEFLQFIGAALCNEEALTEVICKNLVFLTCGYDSQQLNMTEVPMYLGHVPAGLSTKSLVHYAQGVLPGKFRQYDYGLVGNLRRYGRSTPPQYDLKNITAPVALHYSDNDFLASVKDVNKLYERLPNTIGKFRVPFKAFNHLDYIIAIDVKSLVYDKLLSLMNEL